MKSARVSHNVGDLHAANAIAASRRLPVAGKIRPGIKVLTQKAAQVQGLKEIYDKGLAEGLSFDDIAARLKAANGCPSYPLTPRNAPYFSVRPGDFRTESAAQAIMDRYGSVRHGDPERRLYSFPVIFPSDDMDLIFREQFEAWKASELLRWSEPDPQTGELMCMRRVTAAPDPSARRRWGGRPTEAERVCDPNDCALFGKGECKHVGTLNFWIPGVQGVGVIELTFTSIYASMGIAETLDMVRMGLGRVSGLMPDGRPIFWLSKQRDRVSRMDWEKGKPEKTDQWIIQLEATGLHMAEVLSGRMALHSPQTQSTPALEAPPVRDPQPAPNVTDATAHDPAEPDVGGAPDPDHSADTQPPHSGTQTAELRRQLSALKDTLDWSNEDLGEWIAGNYGDTSAARDPDKLADMVANLAVLAERAVAQAGDDDDDDEEVPF